MTSEPSPRINPAPQLKNRQPFERDRKTWHSPQTIEARTSSSVNRRTSKRTSDDGSPIGHFKCIYVYGLDLWPSVENSAARERYGRTVQNEGHVKNRRTIVPEQFRWTVCCLRTWRIRVSSMWLCFDPRRLPRLWQTARLTAPDP